MLKTRINVIMVAAVLLMTGCGVRKNAENVVKKNSSSAEKTAVTADIQADAAVVSYLGPEGTYTQEACGKFFGGKGGYEPYETVTDAVAALAEGKSNYAVIPQENTIGGAVTDYVDILISQADASVVGEVELPINLLLFVKPFLKDFQHTNFQHMGMTNKVE